MSFLTPSERRAVVMLALLFALGAGRDLWRARHPRDLPAPAAPGARPDTLTIKVGPGRLADTAGAAPRTGTPDPTRPSAGGGPVTGVDLNHATLEELDLLPGVGPVLARRILEHRERHPFRDVDELLAVRGIGPKLLERLRGRVTVSPP